MKVIEFFINARYFSTEDYKSFGKYLTSPFFNSMKSQLLVYRIIKKEQQLLKLNKYDALKDIIHNKTGYTENTIKKIIASLNEKYIEYAKLQSFKTDDYHNEYLFCKYLLTKGNYRLLQDRVVILDSILSAAENFDHDYFLKMFEVNTLKYSIISSIEEKFKTIPKLDKQKHYTLESSRNIMVFTLSKVTINYINYVLQCKSHFKKKNEAYTVNLEKLFVVVNTHEYNSYNKMQQSIINMLYKFYKLYSNPLNDENYNDCKTYFERIKDDIGIELQKTYHNILLTYCYMRQRLGDKDNVYFTEALKNSYDFITYGYYKNGNTKYLHPVLFRNFVSQCTKPSNKSILKKVIKKHANKIHPLEKDLMTKFSYAHLYYLEGKYDLVIGNCETLKNPKAFYRYDINNLLIKTNYALGRYEEIRETLHNYKAFIKNDKVFTENDKERYYYFIDRMNELNNCHNSYVDDEDIFVFEFLLNNINKKASFVMKNWITEKVKEAISTHYKTHKKKGINLRARK